ncbi:MAG TPA: acyl-CoA desaturase [Flavipsychrobacter sp.]|nr:acyl-CoA desaturase [Flavipsychrobacter sp.]
MQQKKALVKFAPKGEDSFYDTVRQRVEDYFKTNNISKYANRAMMLKTIVMISLYFVPYLAVVTGLVATPLWLFYGAWILMGLGIVGIGTSVMHDSNHGSYSNKQYINGFLGSLLNILGGYSRNWRIQHNILHHTYTNLDGLDEDIEAGVLLRMSPHKPRHNFHRFQHVYAWFLYMLMNLFWVTVKDFRQLGRYDKEGLLKKEKVTLRQAVLELSLLKVIYVAYIIVLPLMFSGVAWYHVVLGFVGMHMMAGLGLACIFQPAHVMETSTYPEPTPARKVEDTWAVHQVLNTTNFAPDSSVTAWFIGGLNYQIEHHLFPQICHIHYPKIAPIVEKTAQEFNIPYNVQKTFAHALLEHRRMLKILGRTS